MENNNLEYNLSLLNEQQLQAVVHKGNPLLILAGAGSGKTRVITTKIAYLIEVEKVDPFKILSVTFTKKAANEMKMRAVQINEKASQSQIRTFHSFGSWFLRRYYNEAKLEASFTVYDDEDMATLIKKACPSLSTKEVKIAAKEIALAKDYCLSPEDDLSMIASDLDLNEIYMAYQKRLAATGNVDFGDLILLPVKIIQQNPNVADYIHNRFDVIMVDEYQDSNIAQYNLLQSLSAIQENGQASSKSPYVCVVGDDDQSIYKFRGAEVQNILTFPQRFQGTDVIRLEKNYRSTAKILEAAEIVVGHNSDRLGKNLISARGDGKKPVLAFLQDQTAEAVFTGDLIKKSVQLGDSYSDWAILYRTNAQSLTFEKEFLHRKIPYQVVGSLKFYEREEIKDAIAYLSLAANPRDEISFRRVVNKPSRAIGEKTQDKIILQSIDDFGSFKNFFHVCKDVSDSLPKKAKEGIEKFIDIYENIESEFSEEKSLSVFIEKIISKSGLDEYHKAGDEIEGTTRLANLQEFVNSALPYECTKNGLNEFLDAINLDRSLEINEDESQRDCVTLITLHNTKGLEYNKVIITGLEEGIFPRADKLGLDLEEERRLFYVGITRAKNELYVTSVSKRIMYGTWQYMKASLFIKESSSAFKVIGEVPFGFSNDTRGYYREENSFIGDEKQAIADQWPKGTKIYHDDYGYGIVVSCIKEDSEVVIEVHFETGGKKRFLPEYQKKSLLKIKE